MEQNRTQIKTLIKNIEKIQYRAKKSEHGVGLFTIKSIKKDDEIFGLLDNLGTGSYYDATEVKKNLSKEHISLVEDYHCNPHGELFIPDDYNDYCSKLRIVYFLNHSNKPNIARVDTSIKALRDININEELFVDYNYWCGGTQKILESNSKYKTLDNLANELLQTLNHKWNKTEQK